MTPNCCSFALLLNSRSVWTQEEEDERATSTLSPTSSTLCSTSSTRMHLLMENLWPQKLLIRHSTCTKDEVDRWTINQPLWPTIIWYGSCVFSIVSLCFTNCVTAEQGLHPGRRRTCRVSRNSHVRNGWRAHTRLKDRTISPFWQCTSCHLNAGGLHGYTSYGDSWSMHTPARSQQSAQTSMTLRLFFYFFVCLYFTTDAGLVLQYC